MRIEDLPLLSVTDLKRLKKTEILDYIEEYNQDLQKFFLAMKKEFGDRIRELEHNPDLALSALMEDYRKQMEKPKPVKMGRPELSDDVKRKVIELRENGLSFREIAAKVKISVGSVSKILNS